MPEARIPVISWTDVPMDLQEMVGATLYEEIDSFIQHRQTSKVAGLTIHSSRMEDMVAAFYAAIHMLGLPVAPNITIKPWYQVHPEHQGWIWYTLLHETTKLMKASEFCRSPLVGIPAVTARTIRAAAAYRAAAVILGYAPENFSEAEALAAW